MLAQELYCWLYSKSRVASNEEEIGREKGPSVEPLDTRMMPRELGERICNEKGLLIGTRTHVHMLTDLPKLKSHAVSLPASSALDQSSSQTDPGSSEHCTTSQARAAAV